MDDGRSCRSIVDKIYLTFISMILTCNSLFCKNYTYIIANDNLNIKSDLIKEGYELVKKNKYIYLVHPVLYKKD